MEDQPINRKYQSHLSLDAMSSELRLIVCCLRASISQEEGECIGALCSKGVDWDSFKELTDYHRVVSPVFRMLKQFAGNRVPELVFGTLRDAYHKDTQRVLAKTGELVRIVKGFQERGIPVLPFKGPVLSLLAYGELGLRHVGDLDIMVPPEQTLEAHEILVSWGYRRIHPDFELTPRQMLAYLRSSHHLAYFSRKQGIEVELHWRFESNRRLFPLRFNVLWKDRQTLQLGGIDVATFSLEHTLLHLCTHGARHGWFRLFWLADVARLTARSETVDWDSLMRSASRLGIERMVAEGLVLAELFFGVSLPGPFRVLAEKDTNVHRLARMAQYFISTPDESVYRPFTRGYSYKKLTPYLLRRDIPYKISYFLKMLGPTSYIAWQRFPLPDNLFFLYSLLRPFSWMLHWYALGKTVHKKGSTDQRR